MTVYEVITLAKQGELKNLGVSSDNSAIIGFINLGLIELYKRFPIETNEVLIQIGDRTSPYYINDTTYRMPSNYMFIIAAYDEIPADNEFADYDNSIPINEEENHQSILTIGFNKIQIPAAPDRATVSVLYLSSPVLLNEDDILDDNGSIVDGYVEVPLPYTLMEAMLHYIGYRGHGSVESNVQTENNTHYMRFESSCSRIRELGLITPDDLNSSIRFRKKGFV